MSLEIVTIKDHPEGTLRQKAKNLSFPLSREDKNFVQAMKDKICELGGVGLAANQVNALKRVAVIYIPAEAQKFRKDTEACAVYAMINPWYEPHGDKTTKDFEGCYSIPDYMGEVERPYAITVHYQTEDGAVIEKILEGFHARVAQHEIDHLDGILYTDRLTADSRKGPLKEMMALRRAEMSPEQQAAYDAIVNKNKGNVPD